jgi:hypothetical protein
MEISIQGEGGGAACQPPVGKVVSEINHFSFHLQPNFLWYSFETPNTTGHFASLFSASEHWTR